MITITRRLAAQLRAVFRRALGAARGTGPALCFTADADTLSVKAASADAAIEYRGPGSGPAESLWLPFEFLADCEGKQDESVQLEAAGGRVAAQWRDRGIPQLISYVAVAPADADKFPTLPQTLAENPPALLRALVDAFDSTDPDSARFSLGCVQARPDGSLCATDGRELLVQSGFTFPWQEALLIRRSRIFAASELPQDQPVFVGKTGDWVVFRTGPWAVYLAVNKDGRFPDVTHHIPRPTDATARCQISASDAAFLTQSLSRLPSDDELNWPVTLELNGSIAVRGKAVDQPKPTEVVLSGSSWSGEPVRLNMNRKFLARALKLGFRELCAYSNKTPVACFAGGRNYVWALLAPDTAIPAAEDAIRIASPPSASNTAAKPNHPRRPALVSEPTSNGNGNGSTPATRHTPSNGQPRRATKAGQQDMTGLIQQAESLRTALRETLVKTNDLLKGLKRQRRLNRSLQTTLASLRQLKTLGV